MNFTAERAGTKSKQLAIADHLFTCNDCASDKSLEVVFAISIAGIREEDRFTIAGTEILNVCHECNNSTDSNECNNYFTYFRPSILSTLPTLHSLCEQEW